MENTERRLEEVECPVLNISWMTKNKINENPGLKVQIDFSSEDKSKKVYCEHRHYNDLSHLGVSEGEITCDIGHGKVCIYD